MRSVEQIIRQARLRARQERYDYDALTGETTSGTPQDLCVEFLNDAQDRLMTMYSNNFSSLLVGEYTFDTITGQEAYDLPEDIYMDAKIISIGIASKPVQDNGYSPMRYASLQFGRAASKGFPSSYCLREKDVLLAPIPQGGSYEVRVQYRRQLSKLDMVRGTVLTAVDGIPSGSVLTLDSSSFIDEFAISGAGYLNIVDKDGVFMFKNAPIDSFTGGAAPYTINLPEELSEYLQSGYSSSDLVGGYLTLEKNRTTHSVLPEPCEKYLKIYLQKRLMNFDSKSTVVFEDEEVKACLKDILDDLTLEVETFESPVIVDHWIYG